MKCSHYSQVMGFVGGVLLAGNVSAWADAVKTITASSVVAPVVVMETNVVSGTVTVQAGEPVVITSGSSSAVPIDQGTIDSIAKSVQAALSGLTNKDSAAGAVDAEAIEEFTKAVQSATKAMQSAMPAGMSALALPATGGVVAGGSAKRADAGPQTWLGIGTDEVGDDVRAQLTLADGVGLIVRHVDQDSPAAKAGIQENDILTKFGDQLLLNSEQLRQLVRMQKDGESVTMTGLRKGKETKFKATLAKKESGDEAAQLGVIKFGGDDIQLGIPEEIRKLLEHHKGGVRTVFSTNITIVTPSVKMKTNP